MQWLKVIVAGLFEIGWVIGLKHAASPWEWGVTGICIYISFYFLVMAGKTLPVGTVYAVFAGIGTAGTVLSESLIFGAPFQPLKIVLIAVLLLGIVGLKMAEDHPEKRES
ncbi:DMT family transporter [Salibacterium aidingense]|uniref:DMT family transporter n=1 Tax=Salibacterium aidingense TaxID=384933 RepID=UPI003BCD89B3